MSDEAIAARWFGVRGGFDLWRELGLATDHVAGPVPADVAHRRP